jgi:hypothetical protein
MRIFVLVCPVTVRARNCVLAATLAALVGCGSTVPPSERAATGGALSGSLGEGPLTDGSPDRPADGPAGAAPGSAPGPAAARGTTQPPSGQGQTEVVMAPVGTPPKHPLLIGIELEENAGITRSAFGVKDPSTADPAPLYRAVAAWVNAHGGLGGHRLDLTFHYTNLSSGTFESQEAQTCADFTEDHHVFAMVTAVTRSLGTVRCLTKHRLPGFVYRLEYLLPPAELKAALPYLYLPVSLNGDREASFIDGIVRQGKYPKTSRIGLISYSGPI